MAMRRSFRRYGDRPARTWASLAADWVVVATASGAQPLLRFETPTSASNLTSSMPEDITVLRLVGNFQVGLGAGDSSWTLGLMVTDATWQPTGTFAADADKRVLWHETYHGVAATALVFTPPGLVNASFEAPREAVHVDIAPKVKVEPGKALQLVWWKNSGSVTMTTTSVDMRVLFQRSRRR